MDSNVLIVIGVVAALLLVRFFFKPRRPKETTFRCTRCKSVSRHTSRTINAWRDGKTSFFCNTCHAKWRESQPHTSRSGGHSWSSPRGSGCFSVVVVAIAIPAAIATGLLLF